MPSTNDTATEGDTQQTDGAATPPTDQSLFDDTPPAPPAAEQQTAETADVAQDAQVPQAPVYSVPRYTAPAPDVPDAPVAPEIVQEVETAPVAPSAPPTRVRLGRVYGTLHRVPLEAVQALTAECGSRIVSLQGSPAIANLQKRMRATEGRCAPIVFTLAEGDTEPKLFSGLESVAAAMNLGLELVFVVVIDAGDAGAAQSFLASWANGGSADPMGDMVEVIPDDLPASPA